MKLKLLRKGFLKITFDLIVSELGYANYSAVARKYEHIIKNKLFENSEMLKMMHVQDGYIQLF